MNETKLQTSSELSELRQLVEELTAELLLEKKLSQVYKNQAQSFQHRMEIAHHEIKELREKLKALEEDIFNDRNELR